MDQNTLSGRSMQDNNFLNALADSFRLQEAILFATDLAIISATPEGIITMFNRAAEDMLGYTSEEVIGKSNALIFHDAEEVKQYAEELRLETGAPIQSAYDAFTYKAWNEQEPQRREWTMVRKDESRFPALISVASLKEVDGTLLGYVIIPTDLSERKRIDENARLSEQKFKLLAENIPGAIYLCNNDEAYSMIYLNNRVKEITGYDAEDFVEGSINFAKLFHPEDAQWIFKTIDEAVRERRRYHIRYRLQHKSGEWRWIEEVGEGVYVNNKLRMLEGFISDITTQKKAEEKLQKIAEENLRFFNNSIYLNVIAGYDGYFKRVSSTCMAWLGWTEEEFCSRPFIEFVHPDDVEATADALTFIAAGNDISTFENRYQCKDGSYRWLLWGAASDLGNQVMYSSAIDITERKLSEEALIQSKNSLESIAIRLQEQNRQLDEFAHIISHNLRSPVANIQALINLLDENSGIDDYRVIYEKLRNVSKNLGETMNDLMDTMKVRTNTNIERTEMRFKDILDKVVQTLEGELILAEASVTFDFNKAAIVKYPKAYLESIFQNLLSNAIKYRSPERKAKIHFESKITGDFIELSVSDNGQGIDMERYGEKLFGLHRTFHSHKEARGVGLFLIKNQVESMGGFIKADSTVNRGTTFTISFKWDKG